MLNKNLTYCELGQTPNRDKLLTFTTRLLLERNVGPSSLALFPSDTSEEKDGERKIQRRKRTPHACLHCETYWGIKAHMSSLQPWCQCSIHTTIDYLRASLVHPPLALPVSLQPPLGRPILYSGLSLTGGQLATWAAGLAVSESPGSHCRHLGRLKTPGSHCRHLSCLVDTWGAL